jgi:hypothetical protein
MSAESPIPPAKEEAPASPVIALLAKLPAKWVALGLLAVIVVVVLLLRGGGDGDTEPATPTPSLSPLPVVECETIISSGAVQVAASLPITLSVSGESIPVVPVMLDEHGWSYQAEYSGKAVWICGTVVNYVLGLEPTRDNERLLESLSAGDLIGLTLANGTGFLFRYDDASEVFAADASSIFDQSEPAVTLLVEVDDGVVLAVRAEYETASEPLQPVVVGEALGLYTPVQVGNARLTVVSAHARQDVPGLLQGTMYYLVELEVANVGEVSLETSLFNMVLEDSIGNQYLLSPPASAVGDYGPLQGTIAPGSLLNGTAGYLVPETLAGPTLVWTFSPKPTSGEVAQVRIPYEAEPFDPGLVYVTVSDAFLSTGGDELVIVGEIRNTTSSALIVSASDIRLSSSAGMGNLRMAAPFLPWTVEPGETQVIELQYDPPGAATALLTMLGFSFEISGLPEPGGFGGVP